METTHDTDLNITETEGEPTAAGGERPAWMAQLPDDLKDSGTLTGFQSIGDLGRAYLDARGELDESVRMPEEEATEEEKTEFWRGLGVPEEAGYYEFDDISMPEGLEGVDEFEDAFRDMAHRAGLLDAQARDVHRFFMESFRDAYEAEQQARREGHDQAVGELQREWGTGYERNVELALRAAHRFGGDAMTQWLEETGAGDLPEVIRAWHAVGEAIADDTTVMGSTGGSGERERMGDGTPVLPMKT